MQPTVAKICLNRHEKVFVEEHGVDAFVTCSKCFGEAMSHHGRFGKEKAAEVMPQVPAAVAESFWEAVVGAFAREVEENRRLQNERRGLF